MNALANGIEKAATTNGTAQADEKSSTEQLADMLEYHHSKIDAIGPVACRESIASNEIPAAVLLMGSTGALGSYLFLRFLSHPEVNHIYCLHRIADAKDLHIKSNQVRDLTADFLPDRVTFLAQDLTKPNFRVQGNEFQDPLSKVTYILHCA
jgi:hypothetical protein